MTTATAGYTRRIYEDLTMETKIQKWGNSLGVRIPRSVALEARLRAGSAVEVSAEDDVVVIRPVSRVRYQLSDLLKGVYRRNRHAEVVTGEPVGRESL
jgi:antitoxin MazE